MDTEKISCAVERLILNAPLKLNCNLPSEEGWLGSPVADWLSGVGTAGAAIIALVLAFRAEKAARKAERRADTAEAASLKEQQKRLKQEQAQELEDKRSQAKHVAAWLEVLDVSDLDGKPHDWRPDCQVIIDNASDEPIWEVGVFHWSLGASGHSFLPVVPPGQRRTIKVKGKPAKDGLTIEEAVKLIFRDNTGRDWQRAVIGNLILIHDNPFRGAIPETTSPEDSDRDQQPVA
ncbi:hypothetical protein LJR013_003909 [Pseudarthrobacter oxydans]|uniref:hypothetical protein n=1 Tax=Pseudarthrobacter oxydans TaxID=1671 RepID=UPI003ECDCCA7